MLLAILLASSLLDGTLSLLGRHGMGSACPISETRALTVEHVTSVDVGNGIHRIMPMIWSDSLGNSGWGQEILADLTRDLSLFEVREGTFSKWFPISSTEAKKGDFVYILGYDFEKGAIRKEFRVKVLNSDAAHLVYDRGAQPGSSGSCILNEAGEVVGINTGYFALDFSERGRGLNVWGPWAKFRVPEGLSVKEKEKDVEEEAIRRP